LDALFYPTLSLPGAAWTNPNLLFFDEIGVIAPEGDERELFDGPTRLLMRHGLVRPVEPIRYAQDDEGDGHLVSHLLGMAQLQPKHGELARIHLGKIAFTRLPSELRELGLLWPSHCDDWLEGPTWVASYVMSVLATRMASHPRLNASLVTNLRSAGRLVAGVPQVEFAAASRRVRAVSRLLPIGPDAELAEILRFRERHRAELRRFRGLVEGLVRRSPDGPDGEADFDARLRQAEEVRRHLVGELEAVRTAAPPLPVAISIATIAAPAVEAAYCSAAVAVAGLGYLLYTRGAAARRERAARRDGLVYAALAAKTFAARRGDDVLR
jgi:hypothetical protein